MPKVDLDTHELTLIDDALNQAMSSAKRGQNTGKTPQFRALYAEQHSHLSVLQNKLRLIPAK